MQDFAYHQEKTFTTWVPKLPAQEKLRADAEGVVPPTEPVPSVSLALEDIARK